MTEQTTASQIPAQAGPPLADTSDMAQVHQVLRNAIAEAPNLFGSAAGGGPERTELVATYYDNILQFLKVHHEGEDDLVWPRLWERAPEQAAEIRRIADQHHAVTDTLQAAGNRVAEFRATGDEATAATAATALAELGAALLPHLDEEESYILPLAAQHIYAPEWGELPGHAMRSFGGDKLWLIQGLIREQFRPEQIAMMDEHMPPPVFQMWTEQGQYAFADFVAELRNSR
jgi:hemerythrin-like domain-containing protein